MADLAVSMRAEIDRLRALHAAEIDRMRAAHAAEIDRMSAAHAAEIGRMRAAHAAEVSVLGRRVRALEQALAKANRTGAGSRLPTEADIADARHDLDETGDPDPAGTWSDDDATFEERVAAKAFFCEEGVDDSSREWLLGRR